MAEQPKFRLDRKFIDDMKMFITSLKAAPTANSGVHQIQVMFEEPGLGGIMLDGKEADDYVSCRKQLINITSKSGMISAKAVERLWQKAILQALDINDKQLDVPFEQRIENSLQELENKIHTPPIEHNVYALVHGMSDDGLPFQYGDVEFIKFDETVYNQVVSNSSDKVPDPDFFLNKLKGNVVALVKVKAIDPDAARSLAIKKVKLTLDVINFFSDLVPFSTGGYAFLPGYAEDTFTQIVSEAKGVYSFFLERVGPIGTFSLKSLSKIDVKDNIGFETTSNLLKKQGSDVEKRLLSAIQWAGRATAYTNRNKEEAFLLYMIALESVILFEDHTDQLSYSLRLRTSYLLGKNFKGRKKIHDDIKNLYVKRSKIVHDGFFDVEDADLNLIRYITKSAILSVLCDNQFKGIKTRAELSAWFDKKILNDDNP